MDVDRAYIPAAPLVAVTTQQSTAAVRQEEPSTSNSDASRAPVLQPICSVIVQAKHLVSKQQCI